MAKTLTQIEQQIAKLQAQAQALKAREAAGVIERIKAAIAHYGITPQQLFDTPPKAAARQAAKKTPPKSSTNKAPLPVKYRDEAGNAWSGHGKRPKWFLRAIESGKTREDLAVKPQ